MIRGTLARGSSEVDGPVALRAGPGPGRLGGGGGLRPRAGSSRLLTMWRHQDYTPWYASPHLQVRGRRVSIPAHVLANVALQEELHNDVLTERLALFLARAFKGLLRLRIHALFPQVAELSES